MKYEEFKREYKRELKATTMVAIPVIIGQLGQMMMGVVDSIMVGRVGAAPLAASSIAHGLFMLLMVIGIGVALALSPLVSIQLGAGKPKECGVVLRQGLLVNMLVGVVLMIVNNSAAVTIRYMDQPPEVVGQAIAYMETLGWSMVPMMLFLTYKQFIEGLSVMRPAMIITLLANLVNIFANWVLIFGNLGAPEMGLVGAGWATFSTRISMAVAIVIYVYSVRKFKPYDITLHYRSINRKVMKEILRVGLPGGFQYFFEVGAFAGSAILIGWLGTLPLAAHQIALNLAAITYMFALGFSSAAAIRVGLAMGRKDRHGMRMAGFSAFSLAVAMTLIFATVFVVFRYTLPGFYIDDPQVIEVAASLLLIAALFQISDGTQAVGIGVLRGLTDVRIPTIITFIAYWLIGLPGGYLLGFTFGLGVEGVWYSFVVALTVSAILLSVRFEYRTRHIKI